MTVLKVFFASLYALIVGLVLSWRENDERPSRRWAPLYDPMYAVWVLSCVFVLVVLMGGWDAGTYVFHLAASLLFHALIYYALLLLCLPLLRRYFSAQTCATLWLLPNFLVFAERSLLRGSKPLLLIPVNRRVALWLLVIWAVGAVAVLLWQVIHHLRYRRTLLRGAVEVCGRVYALWESECRRADYTKTIPLLYSNTTATPVSIGLMRGSLRVLLPRRDYTEEELTLIFRHELFHLRHMDISMKFFLSFCTAFGWFNPFMWIARRKASEDLELSCDEEVMRYSNAYERKEYARLILDHAADERGFTTCLSASAGALRYRLSRVMDARKRWGGSVVVGLAVLLLLLGYGQVDFSFDRGTVGELLPLSEHQVEELTVKNLGGHYKADVYAWDEELLATLQSIPMRSVYGNYDYGQLDHYDSRSLHLNLGGGPIFYLSFHEDYAYTFHKLDGETHEQYFLYAEAPDWDTITALLDFEAENPDPPAEIPDLHIRFGESEQWENVGFNVLSATDDKDRSLWETHRCTIQSPAEQLPPHIALDFSYPPETWSVIIEYTESGEREVIPGEAIPEQVIDLSSESACYTILGTFTSQGVLFEMAAYLDVIVE